MYNGTDGKLVKILIGHGHWINSLSLNTDFVLRTGAYDHTGKVYDSKEEGTRMHQWINPCISGGDKVSPEMCFTSLAQQAALERWKTVSGGKPEILASGSDDHTIYLWEPTKSKKPLTRMTGHQVRFVFLFLMAPLVVSNQRLNIRYPFSITATYQPCYFLPRWPSFSKWSVW